ncbi:hypothetical protein MTO96_045431 [Rhipicephalus appendiculatus]
MAFLEAFTARLEDIVAPMRAVHERTQPSALPKMALDVPTFTGQATGKSVIDFLDDLSIYRTVQGLSEFDVLEWVLPDVLKDASYPATFTDVLPLPIRPLGPIFRCSWPSPPGTRRPCPHCRNMEGAQLCRPPGGLDIPPALGARASTST